MCFTERIVALDKMGSVTKVKGENGCWMDNQSSLSQIASMAQKPHSVVALPLQKAGESSKHIACVLSVPGVSVRFPQGGDIVEPTTLGLPEALGLAQHRRAKYFSGLVLLGFSFWPESRASSPGDSKLNQCSVVCCACSYQKHKR